MGQTFFTSLTRISDLESRPFEIEPLDRGAWADGDYVICEAIGPRTGLYRVEIVSGRRPRVVPGDRIVGALGRRAATLECVGDWRAAENERDLHALTAAGLVGKAQSVAPFLPGFMRLAYVGHAVRDGRKLTMGDFVSAPSETDAFAMPVVMVVGTSMSAGKTTCGQAVIRALRAMGLAVAAAKVAGAAGYRDVLVYGDAGAEVVRDYVDVGLPSTVCARPVYEAAIRALMGQLAESGANVLMVEVGASPLEPYNGDAAMALMRPHIRCLIAAAFDAYGVLGLTKALDMTPDLVTGPAANTSAAIALVRELTGLTALDVTRPEGAARLEALLRERLSTDPASV